MILIVKLLFFALTHFVIFTNNQERKETGTQCQGRVRIFFILQDHVKSGSPDDEVNHFLCKKYGNPLHVPPS